MARVLSRHGLLLELEMLLLLDDGVREALLVLIRVLLIDDFRISLGGRIMSISHQALVYLVHEALVGVRVRLVERAVDLGFVFFGLHQVRVAFRRP